MNKNEVEELKASDWWEKKLLKDTQPSYGEFWLVGRLNEKAKKKIKKI